MNSHWVRMSLVWCAVVLALLGALAAEPGSGVRLPALFADGMVLQRDRTVAFWGWAAPGAAVQVALCGKRARTVAEADGRWRLALGPFKAGGPFEVTIDAGEAHTTLHDVLIGEVWVCSGQSNMDYTLQGLTGASKEPTITALAESIKAEIAAANDPHLRQFTHPHTLSWEKPAAEFAGQWGAFTPQTARDFTATGYYFAKVLRQRLGVPVGLIKCAWGGTSIEPWMRTEILNQEPTTRFLVEHWRKQADDYASGKPQERYAQQLAEWKTLEAQAKADKKPVPPMPRKPADPHTHTLWPSTLYNGMIAPAMPFAMRGVIWYQGESNAGPYGFADTYGTSFRHLIQDWRAQWGQGDFPFLFVQLANLGTPLASPSEDFWAEVRDEQRRTLALPNTGMAVAVDIGQPEDIHPKNKQDLGYRLALWALADTYRQRVPAVSGPLYRRCRVEGARVLVTFAHATGGLMTGKKVGVAPVSEVAEELKWFQIAGADKQWSWAQATIVGNDTVAVWSDAVPVPVAVRYAWMMGPTGANLYNRAGLPASPFRTDDWPVVHPPVQW
jgi:sialate O-acetylesterase